LILKIFACFAQAADPETHAADLSWSESNLASATAALLELRPDLQKSIDQDDAVWRARKKVECREMEREVGGRLIWSPVYARGLLDIPEQYAIVTPTFNSLDSCLSDHGNGSPGPGYIPAFPIGIFWYCGEFLLVRAWISGKALLGESVLADGDEMIW
jgi:hypothetical protein